MRVDTGRLRVVEPELDPGLELADDFDGDEGTPSPGAYIQKHRQRRGLSLEQLAIATKIPRRSLELLEADRFDELPGPVFVKGFLRCAARALELAPDGVMELLYEQERAALQARRQRPPTGAHPPASTSAPSRLPPRVRNPPQADGRAMPWIKTALPGPHALLWIFVAVFVAFLVLAAFNLIGGGVTPST
jgi:hypothetical protein